MLVDTHTHLNEQRFDEDIELVIKRALEAGVSACLVPGWDLESSLKARDLAERFSSVYFAAGIHAQNCKEAKPGDLEKVEKLFNHPKCIAVGEVGLDYYWENDEETKRIQKEYFLKQIELANKHGLPMTIHAREATGDMYEILKANKLVAGGVLHCYSGSPEMLVEFAKLGLYFGFDGPITYKNSAKPKDCVRICPLDRLLVETDAPYLPPIPYRGQRNEPAYVRKVAEEVALIKGLPINEIEDATTRNFETLFHVKL